MDSPMDQPLFDDEGLVDEEACDRYTHDLMDRFAASPEGREVIEEGGSLGWAAAAMDYGLRHIGVDIDRMTRWHLEEILFDIFPRKISCAPEAAPEIIRELRAFWRFARRDSDPPFANGCLALLESPGLDGEVRRELANPANYGMAKSFVMGGMAAGYDMTTQEGMTAYRIAYNEAMMERAERRGAAAHARRERADARKARRRKRKAQKRSRRRNR